jgi:hypothetical protein
MICVTIPRIAVTPDNALRFPAVSAPIRLISGSLSVMPLELFRRTANGGREREDGSPLYDLVHKKPNAWQTSAQFRKVLVERALSWGNGYARIVNPVAPSARCSASQSAWNFNFASSPGMTNATTGVPSLSGVPSSAAISNFG